MRLPSNELHYIEHEGETLPCWSCPCGQDKDDARVYLVEWDEPDSGVKYSLCHESCIELQEVTDE